MKLNGIDTGRIEAMVAQLKAAAAKMEQGAGSTAITDATSPQKLNFSDALKTSLEQVSSAQSAAQQLGQKFTIGDDKVSLSDVMISMQKANISFQATIQVRNKLVSAYQDIMNMQI